jgi:hypothetical protein
VQNAPAFVMDGTVHIQTIRSSFDNEVDTKSRLAFPSSSVIILSD